MNDHVGLVLDDWKRTASYRAIWVGVYFGRSDLFNTLSARSRVYLDAVFLPRAKRSLARMLVVIGVDTRRGCVIGYRNPVQSRDVAYQIARAGVGSN